MGDVTAEVPPPDEAPLSDEAPLPEDEQPIVPMRDLSAEEDPQADAVPAEYGYAESAEPPRLRMVGGVLLVFAALSVVIALVLPLYRVGVGGNIQSFDRGLNQDFVINAWGLAQQSGSPDSISQLIGVIVGDTPMWGIPLVIVALLLAGAGGIALWRPTVRYVSASALASVALLVGCFAMLGTFLVTAADPVRLGNEFTTTLGPSFWLLLFGLLLSLAGLAFVLIGRPTPVQVFGPAARTERDEPETPPMGFPAPVVLPELDEK
jgi:hypothetical protein